MRVLFFLLVLANLTYLAWTVWVVPASPPPGKAVAESLDTPRVRLLREVMPGDAVAAAAPAAVPAADCVSVGPFEDPALAEASVRRLGELGFATRTRQSREPVWVGHWVRINHLATAEDAANALVTLRARGIGEAVALRNEPPGTEISLGVYTERGAAEQAATAARAIGYATVIRDRLREAEVVWIDVDRSGNGGLPSADEVIDAAARAAHIELRACPAPVETAVAAPAPAAPGPATP